MNKYEKKQQQLLFQIADLREDIEIVDRDDKKSMCDLLRRCDKVLDEHYQIFMWIVV